MHRLPFLSVLFLSGAAPALANGPVFVNRADGLPASHVYDGGWEHFVGGGVAAMDCDGDARPDLFAAGGENPAILLRNVSDPGGEIVFATIAVPPLTRVTGAYPMDADGDGHIDIFILRVGANRLWRGDGACGFTDATAEFGLPQDERWTTAFSATWEEGQSRPTLVIGNYVDRANPDGPFGACDENHLIRPAADRYGPPEAIEPGFCPLSMLISDWRRDGEPLLRVSNDRHYYLHGGSEQMWSLDPLREWTEADDGWPPLSLWGMGIASADITGDGRPEVALTSMGDQLLQRNTGTGFENVPYATGTYAQRPYRGGDGRPSTGWHAEFADFDNDARLDLFIAKGNVDQMPGLAMADPNNLLMQQSDGTFFEAGGPSGIGSTLHRSRGAAIADLNADGRLDIVVVNRRAPMEIWQNATPGTGKWLAIDPRQPGGNTHAVGAFVEVETAVGRQTREITVGGGHASGQALPQHFGLGDATRARYRVIWPDGMIGAWLEADANRTVTVVRPGPETVE